MDKELLKKCMQAFPQMTRAQLESYLRDQNWRDLVLFAFETKEREEAELQEVIKEFEHIEDDAAFEQAFMRKVTKAKQRILEEAALTEEDLEEQLRLVQRERAQERKELDEFLKQRAIISLIEEHNKSVEAMDKELMVLEENGLCEHANYNIDDLKEAHEHLKNLLNSEETDIEPNLDAIKRIPKTKMLDWIEERLEGELEELQKCTLELGKAFLAQKIEFDADYEKENQGGSGDFSKQLEKAKKLLGLLKNFCETQMPRIIEEWEETFKDVSDQYANFKNIAHSNECLLKERIEEIRKGSMLPPLPQVKVCKEIVSLGPDYTLLEKGFNSLDESLRKLNLNIDRMFEEYEASRPQIHTLEQGLKVNLDELKRLNEAKRIYQSERFKDILIRAKEAKLL